MMVLFSTDCIASVYFHAKISSSAEFEVTFFSNIFSVKKMYCSFYTIDERVFLFYRANLKVQRIVQVRYLHIVI